MGAVRVVFGVGGQTIKEDNKELMLRMKNLLKVKGQLRREFKDTKEAHLRTRENLAAAMAKCVQL